MNGNGKNGHNGPVCVTCGVTIQRGELHCPIHRAAWRRALLATKRPYPTVAPLSSQED